MVHIEMTSVTPWFILSWTKTPPPQTAVFPLMVHDDKVTVPLMTKTPPPSLAVFPLMVHDEMVTVPE